MVKVKTFFSHHLNVGPDTNFESLLLMSPLMYSSRNGSMNMDTTVYFTLTQSLFFFEVVTRKQSFERNKDANRV